MNKTRYKTTILQFLTIGLFIALYSIAIKPYIDIFNDFKSSEVMSYAVSFIITIAGSIIGRILIKKKFKPLKIDYTTKNNIVTVITALVPLILMVIYFIFGVETLQKTAIYLARVELRD